MGDDWQLRQPAHVDPFLSRAPKSTAYHGGRSDLLADAKALGIDLANPETMTPTAIALLQSRRRRLASDLRGLEEEIRGHEKTAEALELLADAFEDAFARPEWPAGVAAARKSYQHAPICRHIMSAHRRRGARDLLKSVVPLFERATGFLIADDVSAEALARCEEFGRELIMADALRQPYPEMVFEFTLSGAHIGLLLVDWRATPFIFSRKPGEWVPADVAYDVRDEPAEMPARIALALCILLDSRSVDVSAPISVRRAHGASPSAPPMVSYRRLTIRHSAGSHEAGKGSHSPPRLHWRRGHLRRLRTGAVVPVSPCLVGSAERGVVLKDYKLSRSAE